MQLPPADDGEGNDQYKASMGALFGALDQFELTEVLLFLSSRDLLAWREVSKVTAAFLRPSRSVWCLCLE